MGDQAATSGASDYPGQRLALPQSGPGSLATWGSRVAGLVIDWIVCTVVAVLLFGTRVITGQGWTSWATLVTYFVESTVLCVLAGGSVGQLVVRLAVVRVDRRALGFGFSALRAALICLVIPALVVGTDRRSLQDMAAGTVVVSRR